MNVGDQHQHGAGAGIVGPYVQRDDLPGVSMSNEPINRGIERQGEACVPGRAARRHCEDRNGNHTPPELTTHWAPGQPASARLSPSNAKSTVSSVLSGPAAERGREEPPNRIASTPE